MYDGCLNMVLFQYELASALNVNCFYYGIYVWCCSHNRTATNALTWLKNQWELFTTCNANIISTRNAAPHDGHIVYVFNLQLNQDDIGYL